MDSQLALLQDEVREAIARIAHAESLELFRVTYLGKKGKLTLQMQRLKDLAPEERRAFGADVNRLKNEVQQAFDAKTAEISRPNASRDSVDHTLPGLRPPVGRLHPITQTIREISAIFGRLGFESVTGPEIETEFHNFTALNIPPDHASRDDVDTFYTESGHLLRTQTSTVQVRVMKSRKPPLRVIAPGRVYRPDTVDASHSFMFHQIEGLMVDGETTFAELKGTLYLFLKEFFGPKTKVRFRPHFFPFTEPSVEVDISWGSRGWLEILGAGSVNPRVFDAAGYDSKRVQGFAFGLGVERIAMLRHGIDDIRHFYENDLRFLEQF
ncbi:MAG: phenylalanine--tRNA ligase subunit alpha [Candidatus Omnitrophica bacterium]|nr:phenylalanine--tRNA ligase subunit alpha [Candidatus Omnitrophota bacterium]